MCKELEKEKELVAQGNETKTNLRDSLKPRLEALLKVSYEFPTCDFCLSRIHFQSTRPLQEALNMNFEEDWKVKKIANLLPRPLYLVYANLCAYSEACGNVNKNFDAKNVKFNASHCIPLDNLLSTGINGDEFDAKNLEEIEKFNNKDDMDDNTQDSDNDDNDGENVSVNFAGIFNTLTH